MSAQQLPRLTVEFLEDKADGLRRVSQANWPVKLYISFRSALPTSLRGHAELLDVPGVYLLFGPPERAGDRSAETEPRVYIGQADSVADRLDNHLRSEEKKWWKAVAVLTRGQDPLNLSQCKYLESTLCERAAAAGTCTLANANAPRQPAISHGDRSDADDFLEKALVMLGAFGWTFFQPLPVPPKPPSNSGKLPTPPGVPPNLKPLLDELKAALTDPTFPKAEWYWTRVPDFRAKIAPGPDYFRVFARITWAKGWFWVALADVGKYKIMVSADINDAFREAAERAYKKAEDYLRRGKSR